MGWSLAPGDELAARLGSPPPIALLIGAGVSMPAPARLPTAGAWKTHLLGALTTRSDLGFDTVAYLKDYLEDLSGLGRTTDVKLEAVLQSLDDRRPDLARDLVHAAIVGATPNPLHHLIGDLVTGGHVTCVVTPNFDELVEASTPGLTSWATGEPVTAAAVLHVHGHLTTPGSLRHTLNRFGARLPPAEHRLVADALDGEVVALGWSATDPDLLAALAEGAGTVHVLVQGTGPSPETNATLLALSEHRPVVVHTGGFDAILPGLSTSSPGRHLDSGARGATRTAECIDRLSVADARLAVSHLSFRYAVSNQPRHPRLLGEWASRRGADPGEEIFLRLARAEAAQAWSRPHRAVVENLHVWKATRDPAYLSSAGDAVERLFHGINPFKRILALPVHAIACRLQEHRSGRVDPWARARLARCLSGVGSHASARRHLDTAMREAESTDSSLWVRGHLHRLRALEAAYVGQDWRADVQDALECFRFDNRPLEMGNVHRAEAACHLLAGGPGWRSDAMRSLECCERLYQQAPDASAFPLLRMQRAITRLPHPVARLLLRLA